MRRPTTRWWATGRLYAVPLIIYLALASIGLRQGTLVVDTATYAAVGLQAWRSFTDTGSLAPLWTLMGQGDSVPYFNKPPLALWVHGLALHTLGTHVWVARLPTVILGAITLLTLVHTVRLTSGRMTALLAGVLLATSAPFIGSTHAISLDVWLGAGLMGAVCLTVRAVNQDDPRQLWLAGIPIGLALLVKPFVALLAFPILGAWLIADRRRSWIPASLIAVALALLISAPWHMGMVALHDEVFTDQYLGRQIVDRAAGTLGNANEGAGTPLYYLRVLAEVYWPWLPLALVAIVMTLRKVRARPVTLLPLIWTVLWLIVFSLHPDKRPRYIVPIYPALAWLIAAWLTGPGPWQAIRRHPARALCRAEVWLAPIAALASITLVFLPVRIHGPRPDHWAQTIQWLEDHPREPVWAGGLSMQQASRVYLATGNWPIPTRNLAGEQIGVPAPGDAILYHHRAPWQPGPGEADAMRTDNGDLVITRLVEETWTPVPRE